MCDGKWITGVCILVTNVLFDMVQMQANMQANISLPGDF